MSPPPIPAVVVGGYLGAGKTTLINGFLRAPKGLRATVLVNDFGAVNIDAGLIENASGDTIALTNGCACCAIGDSLLEAAQNVTGGNNPPDLVIVEASGVAQPRRMADTLLGAARLAPASCLTVINGARLARNLRDKFVARLVRSQIDSADLLALNRFDAAARQVLDGEFPPSRRAKTVANLHDTGATAAKSGSRAEPALDAAPGFHSKVLSVDEPVAMDRLEFWLKSLPRGVERVKAVLMVRRSPVDVAALNVSWAQGLVDFSPATPDQTASCGTLVLIARGDPGLLAGVAPI